MNTGIYCIFTGITVIPAQIIVIQNAASKALPNLFFICALTASSMKIKTMTLRYRI